MDWDQNQYVELADKVSGGSFGFLKMLEAENPLWSPDRQSDVYSNGVREDSWGFCQFHKPSHPGIVNDPKFFTDPKWQMEQCWAKFQASPLIFHGYARTLNDPEFNALIESHFTRVF